LDIIQSNLLRKEHELGLLLDERHDSRDMLAIEIKREQIQWLNELLRNEWKAVRDVQMKQVKSN
jgi:hypothetical protein